MTKSTQKKAQKNSFVLYVYKKIKDTGRLPTEIEAKKTKSGITYHSRRLISLGIIEKKGYNTGVYMILVNEIEAKKRLNFNTKKKFVTTKTTSKELRKYKRIHSIQIKLNLPKFDYWYNILRNYLDKKELPYDINKKNQYRVTMMYKELKHTFLLCKECIILYLPNGKDFICDDVDFGMEQVKVYVRQLMAKFSGFFGKDLRIKGMFNFEITRKHIAMMDNSIAKRMHKKKKNIAVWVDGKLRVITDNSFNWNELEAITNDNAVSDVKAMDLMIKDVITNKHTITDVKELVENESATLYKRINELQEIMKKQQELLESLVDQNSKSFNMQKYIN